MTDDLHKYPGNLRRHEVRPEPSPWVTITSEYHNPLVEKLMKDHNRQLQELFESRVAQARMFDHQLIQHLVDVLQQVADEGTWTPEMHEALREAEQHGFKPQ
jgi:hypothetical protein